MKTLLRLLLKSHHQRSRSRLAETNKGMTLVELLVGSIMAFLIITPMLGFVVDMLNTDRREQVKSNTEQDIQAAVDFIAQDLSQAIYIYDQAGINDIQKTPTKLPPSPANTTGTPILVFWKRQQMKNSLPINEVINKDVKPKQCDNAGIKCNDTYVLSLVAYYQIKDTTSSPTWCQPSGGNCPTRIARYEIREPIRNPYTIDATKPYYDVADLSVSQKGSDAFNPKFSFSKPTEEVTTGGSTNSEVLVNYIDHNAAPLAGTECRTALGNPTDPKEDAPDPAFSIDPTKSFDLKNPTVNVTNPTGLTASSGNPQVLVNYIDNTTVANVPALPTPPDCKITLGVVDPTGPGAIPIKSADLLITDKSTNSFYACVDTSKNIARVTIRGNSLRRLQTDAPYNKDNPAFFPTASVQVQGLGARGK